MEYEKEYIKKIVSDRCDIRSDEIDGVVSMICQLTDNGKKLFENWVNTGCIFHFDVDGVTDELLSSYYGFKEMGVISMYDWLMRDPDKAIEALRPTKL